MIFKIVPLEERIVLDGALAADVSTQASDKGASAGSDSGAASDTGAASDSSAASNSSESGAASSDSGALALTSPIAVALAGGTGDTPATPPTITVNGYTVGTIGSGGLSTSHTFDINEDQTVVFNVHVVAGFEIPPNPILGLPGARASIDNVSIMTGTAWGVDNGTISITEVAGGTATERDYIITYTGNANFSGNDFFAISASDTGSLNIGQINLDINPVTDGHHLDLQSSAGSNSSLVSLSFLANASDASTSIANGGLESLSELTLSFSQAVHLNKGSSSDGGLTWNVDLSSDTSGLNNLQITSDTSGSVSYTARVTSVDRATVGGQLVSGDAATSNAVSGSFNITSTAPNQAPVIGSSSIVINEDGTGSVTLSLSDDASGLTTSILAGPAHGSAAIQSSDSSHVSVSYQPGANYAGNDSFTIRVTDAEGLFTDRVVPIAINPVTDGHQIGTQSIGHDDASHVRLQFSAGSNDFSFDVNNGGLESPIALNLSFSQAVHLNKGASSDGGLTWSIPLSADDYSGLSDIIVTSDTSGTINYTATVSSVDRAIVDGQLVSGAIVISNPRGGGFSILADAPPSVGSASISTNEDSAGNAHVDLLAHNGDTSSEQDIASVSVLSGPSHGSVSLNSDSSGADLSYQPDANYSGNDSLTIRVTGTNGLYTDRIISIAVLPVADGVSLGSVSLHAADPAEANPSAGLSLTSFANDASSDPANGGLENTSYEVAFSRAVHLNAGSSSDGGLTWNLSASELASNLQVTSDTCNRGINFQCFQCNTAPFTRRQAA